MDPKLAGQNEQRINTMMPIDLSAGSVRLAHLKNERLDNKLT